jgi:hypothetical protein
MRLHRQTVELQERQLVPVSSLKNDLAVANLKEPASAQTPRVAPFENCPVSIFEFETSDKIIGFQL